MSQETSKGAQEPPMPPVSVFAGPIAELVGHRLLSPPTRPGLLASLGRYEIVRLLGAGGMGVVVLARDTEQGNEVAIKMIKPELVSNQRVVHRFVKEAGHLRKLKHPAVVPVLEVSDRPEGPYFVMPYFERGSLASLIRPGQPLEPDVILDLARQVADGLVFAHRRGIIHRDLKPANILLGQNGAGCLADFGLARTLFNDSIIDVEAGQMEGTAPYMSPGVAAGNAEDTRCDIYAFGALLYEMLTGDPPYVGRSTADIRKQILDGPPRPILIKNPGADSGLMAVAEGAMARPLRDRYADMGDVLADLDRIKAGKSVVGPRGIVQRAKRLPTGALIAIAVVAITLGVWIFWPASKEIPEIVKAAPPPPVVKTAPVTAPPKPVAAPPPAPVDWHLSLLAGSPGVPGDADGPAADARFRSPGGIAVDKSGTIYVADTGNDTVRKIGKDGVVSTLAGTAGQAGSLDGDAGEARFLAPLGIDVDGKGYVYLAEFAGDTVRKITPEGQVSTLAGLSRLPGSENGRSYETHFRNPWSVAVWVQGDDRPGAILVVDNGNSTIREILPTDDGAKLAGEARSPGYADGPGGYARFRDPHGIAVSKHGNIYVADTGNNVIREMNLIGVVSTLAGNAGKPGTNDGMRSLARFSDVESLTVGPAGDIFVLDGETIRRVTPEGMVTTLPKSAYTDGNGVLIHPTGIALDEAGDIYLADPENDVIWKVKPPHS